MNISTVLVICLFLVGVGVALYERGRRKGIEDATAIYDSLVGKLMARSNASTEEGKQ